MFRWCCSVDPTKTEFSIVHSPVKVMHHVNNLRPAYRLHPQINSCGNKIKWEKYKVEDRLVESAVYNKFREII